MECGKTELLDLSAFLMRQNSNRRVEYADAAGTLGGLVVSVAVGAVEWWKRGTNRFLTSSLRVSPSVVVVGCGSGATGIR